MTPQTLRAARVAKQVSLRELAKTLDISPAYLSAIETGQRTPNTQIMERLAWKLDVPYHKHVYRCTACGLSN